MDEIRRTIEILESRDLGIAEFHAMQLPVAKTMRQLLAVVEAAKAWVGPRPNDEDDATGPEADFDAALSALEEGK